MKNKFDRRDFLKLAGIGLAGIFMPGKLQNGVFDMTQTNKLGDLLREMRDPNLPSARENEIVRILNEMSDREEKYKSWLRMDGGIKDNAIDFPLYPMVNSRILEKDEADVSFDIPASYNHLLLIGSGRSSNASYGVNLWGEFNNDAGANYSLIYDGALNSANIASHALSSGVLLMGVWPGTLASDGEMGSFFAYVPHYKSTFYKSVLCLGSCSKTSSTQIESRLMSSWWKSTNPVQKVRFYLNAGDLLAGSVLSVYGIK